MKNICDRLVLLEDGVVKAMGEPEYVIDVYHGKAEPQIISDSEE